jgi:hypothetical protein
MNRGAAALAPHSSRLPARRSRRAVIRRRPAGCGRRELRQGVENPQRAWQHWTLNCQGCHRPDGHGSPGAAPDIAGAVAKFLRVDGGRDYLGRVPGVATSPLANNDLAEVLNWMLWRFDAADIPANFQALYGR